VRQCTTFAQASSEGIPISAYAPRSRGARDIDSLVHEIINAPLEQAQEKRA
jgi:cellulose biosynthesis protein BcsQ